MGWTWTKGAGLFLRAQPPPGCCYQEGQLPHQGPSLGPALRGLLRAGTQCQPLGDPGPSPSQPHWAASPALRGQCPLGRFPCRPPLAFRLSPAFQCHCLNSAPVRWGQVERGPSCSAVLSRRNQALALRLESASVSDEPSALGWEAADSGHRCPSDGHLPAQVFLGAVCHCGHIMSGGDTSEMPGGSRAALRRAEGRAFPTP